MRHSLNVSGAVERVVVAIFGGAFAGFVMLILMGLIWFMGLGFGSAHFSKVLLLYIPVATGAVFAVGAIFAPERTADYFGALVQRIGKDMKNSVDHLP